MKKLFLTSQGLSGLFKIVPKTLRDEKIAFVPTAGDTYENKWFIESDRNKLHKMGFKTFELDIKEKTENELAKILENTKIVFVSGGNSFYLLEKARKSGFDKVITNLINKGLIYIGASAGAVLAGSDIEPISLIDDLSKAPDLKSTKGLNLVDFTILPHYGDEKYVEKYKKIMRNFNNQKYKLVTITNTQAIIVRGNSWKVIESV